MFINAARAIPRVVNVFPKILLTFELGLAADSIWVADDNDKCPNPSSDPSNASTGGSGTDLGSSEADANQL